MVYPASKLGIKKAVYPASKLGIKKAVYPANKSGVKKVRVSALIFSLENYNIVGGFFMSNLKLVCIDPLYCEFLRKYDKRVSYNSNQKKTRPFVGILFTIDFHDFFAPLSSPKKKHLKMKNKIDFYKIESGALGVVNFNNMIPVSKDNYKIVDLNKSSLTKEDQKYQELLRNQLAWLNKNQQQIRKKAYKLYYLYSNKRLSPNIKSRCCNFLLLQEKCEKYSKENSITK